MELHAPFYKEASEHQTYEQKERQDLLQRILDFHSRFGYVPTIFFGEPAGQAVTVSKRPVPGAPNVMPLKEAAAYLNMNGRKLRDYCTAKKIAHSRPDTRTYLFRRQDLDAWLERYRHEPKKR